MDMLEFLSFHGVGPAPVLGPMALAPRLNFITGDNGLGKSFMLDAAWWVLTRTAAADRAIKPQPDVTAPTIDYHLSGADRSPGQWVWEQGRWHHVGDIDASPALVVYAHADGGFGIWDPVRNTDTFEAFHFTQAELWQGTTPGEHGRLCNGLIHDWVRWQRTPRSAAFAALKRMLQGLSPSAEELLMPGKPCHIGSLDDTEYPTLHRPQGVVPLPHTSSAIRRVMALAYGLIWAWQGHQRACREARVRPAAKVVVLIDEVECHLHAKWQRRIVPALIAVIEGLTRRPLTVQMVIATHSPLVLASMEAQFDEQRDALFTLGLQAGQVQLVQQPWGRQGDVVNWLVSESFGLRQARSLEAEAAIDAAEAWMRGERTQLPAGLETEATIQARLLQTLPAGDHFWPCWVVARSGVAP